MSDRKAFINVRVPANVKRGLEVQARREGVTLAEYIRKHFGALVASGTIKIVGDGPVPVEQIAKEHARWFVDIISPMIESVATTFFIHGHKHGVKDEQTKILNRIKQVPKEMQKPSKPPEEKK